MESGQFSAQILHYLESSGKTLNEALLEEGAARIKNAFKRQLMEDREDKPGTLRMSAGGQCVRKQWYNYTGAVGEPLSGRTLATFLTGDMLEVGLSMLGRLAGFQLMGKPNGEDEIEIDGVKGHPDDILYVPSEKKYYLIEYKTMSEYSYRKFEKDGLDDSWGYFTQASLYCEAMGIEEFILIGLCKNTGHICDKVYKKHYNYIARAKGRWETIKNATSAPGREFDPIQEEVYNRKTKSYDPTGRMTVPIQCQYCAFLQSHCHPNIEVEFKGEKPQFILPSSQPITMEV